MRWFTDRPASRLADALAGHPTARPSEPDTRELMALADQLSTLRLAAAPDPAFRATTRAQLIALAERSEATATEPAGTRGHRRVRTPTRPVAAAWSRRLAGAMAALAVLVATLGVLTIVSRDALPGDSLYAVKRGSEQAQVALTFDESARGFVLLHQAERRLDEVTALLDAPGTALAGGRPGQPLAAGGTDDDVIRTLTEMDEQTQAGIALLTGAAVAAEDEATLAVIPVWAEGQQGLLDALVPEMSAEERSRAESSLALLDRVGDRARSLGQSLPCECLDAQGPADELGPVPCGQCAGPGDPATPTGTPTDGTAPPPSSDPQTSGNPPPTGTPTTS